MFKGNNPYQNRDNYYFIDLSIVLFSIALGAYGLFINKGEVIPREDRSNLEKKTSDGEITGIAISDKSRR